MLGAQTIRTKQKNKERKKKLSGPELQCERIQKAAREDARAVSEIAEETKRIKQRRHHSVQEPQSIRFSSIDNSDTLRPFSKSTSTSFTKMTKPERSGVDFVNTKDDVSDKKISKWCGLLASFSSAGNSRQSSKKPPKRRMSTFI
uniref:Uncharacterized protein n=1 Tax=Loa loa TaxID=7209 RepID=A0A1I7VTJ4_LOALO